MIPGASTRCRRLRRPPLCADRCLPPGDTAIGAQPRPAVPDVTGTTGGNSRGPGGAQVPVTMSTRLRSLTGAPAPQSAAEPVTVTVARVVRPGQQDAFEEWAARVQELLATFPGNLGS